jgi:porphobilinogen synthase
MVRETRMDASSLVYPMFVMDGDNTVQEIPSMYGQYRYTVDRMGEKFEELLDAGVSKVMLFGIPAHKDDVGSQAYAEDGIIQRAFREAKSHYPEMYLIGDVCMCEYTSHGHCGILKGQEVDNDTTLDYLVRIALSQVQAGADMVAPSDMMDGRVAAIRHCLDEHHYTNVPIMSYAVKFASAYYGPFRDAADSAPQFGNRKSYQMDFHNRREAIKEALSDIQEGADIVMVKPAMIYGDLIREIKDKTTVPIAAYSVSGEYAMIKGAAKLGLMEESSLICETAVAAYRSGADIYLTYFAKEIARFLSEGRIG